jgi:hypothetical protein
MDQLSESLRLASADPPPTRIDLDDLIDGEHRAGRRRRWLGAVGGTAAAVIAIAVGAAVIQGNGASPGGTPFGNPGPGTAQPNPTGKGAPGPEDPSVPTPTEPTEVALARLTAALNASLASTLGPDVALSDPNTPGRPPPSFSGEPGGYKAGVTITDSAGSTDLFIFVRPAPMPQAGDHIPQQEECDRHPATTSCQRLVKPDGSVLFTLRSTEQGGLTLEAEHYRIDGTAVTTSLTNLSWGLLETPVAKTLPPPVLSRDGLPLTMDQLLEIVLDPALTLFP